MRYRQVQVIGGRGNGPGQFAGELRGLTVDAHGQVFAAGDSEVKVFDATGRLLRRWPAGGSAHSVAVARDGSVYVGGLGGIEVFDGAGKPLSRWRDEKLFGRVTAIGFVNDGVLAGDATDRAIRHLDRNGRLRNTIGKDSPVKGLLIPNGVVDFGVDAHGVIHAANPGKHRVERYAADGKLLGHIGSFHGTDPAGFGGCCNPTNVAVGAHIYVTEKAGPRAKAYDFDGKLVAVIAADVFDFNCKNMRIAAGPHGRVYVTETVKNLIFAFEPVAA